MPLAPLLALDRADLWGFVSLIAGLRPQAFWQRVRVSEMVSDRGVGLVEKGRDFGTERRTGEIRDRLVS